MKQIRFHIENLAKHGVTPIEAEEALYDGWKKRRKDGDCYEVLGCTDDGLYLQLVAEIKESYIWVFHGRPMNDSERRRYRRK